MEATEARKNAKMVLIAGVLSNFSVGILYTWSNLKDALEYTIDPATGSRLYHEWAIDQLSLPYSIGGMLFAMVLILAGALQDKIGPKRVMLLGICMVGIGTILSGFATHSPYFFFITFGGIVGLGIGFVYACPRPAAMKWFHPSKKGMINGLVVAGFGLGALWLGPLEVLFLKNLGFTLEQTLMILGGLILIIGLPMAMMVKNPPEGYVPPEPIRDESIPLRETQIKSPSVALKTVAKTPQAWMLLVIYAFFCSAGALVISNVTDIMKVQTGGATGEYAITVAALLAIMVPIASISNASGRASGGIISDKIGRKNTYYIIHAVAAINMFLFPFYTTPALVVFGVVVACVAYGSALSVTPSIVADYFGLKNYGANYGLVYYGWGISLIIGPQISSSVKAATGSYTYAYYAAIVLILISVVLVAFLKKPTFKPEEIVD